LKVLFKFNHSVFTSTAKDNFIIVFAKISAVALPIPLVAPVISAVLMIYHRCRNHFIDFVIILEMQFVLNLRYIFTHAFCPDGKPIFFSRSNSTALINDCILVAFTVPAMESLYGVLPKRVKSYQHQHGI
jgi:hypothetical protein